MAIGKIESTGCTVRKGKVQLRFSFYLEPSDPRYEEHHVQVPVIPPEGYLGKVNAEGLPIDRDDYNRWLENLPRGWRDNPFHNHFVYVDPDATDAEIKQLLAESLGEFFAIWAKGDDILKVWKSKGRPVVGDMSSQSIKKCELKVVDIKNRITNFEVRKV